MEKAFRFSRIFSINMAQSTKSRRLKYFLQNFSSQTTVHGLHLIGIPKLHTLERIFWLLVVTIAAGASTAIIYANWTRYLANPTVISLQKDFRNWENPFPAVTGCLLHKTDQKQATKLIFEKWRVAPLNATLFTYYMEFVMAVANISYDNLVEFSKFLNDENLDKIDLLDIAKTVHPKLSGTLVTFDLKQKSKWSLIMTELGMCFTVNSLFMKFFLLNHTDKNDKENILICHFLNGLCYGRYDSDPQLPIKYYVHSYLETVHTTVDPPLIVRESEELEINYRIQETISSKTLRSLSPNQRKCRFYDEPLTNELPVYSTSICYMTCRYKLAMQLCGCKPFFYHMFDGKVCGIQGMVCLSKFAENFTQPSSQIGCQCPQTCDVITYFPQIPKYTRWEYGYFEQRITFRWGLLAPTTKFRREVLFGFEDLVVSFGGTFALFLGISFMSAIETVFLFAENLFNLSKSVKTR